MALKPKKIPMRMCVGCREMKPKRELLRIVRNPEGAVLVDRVGRSPGRGAYVCPDAACLARAQKAKLLDRALEVKLDEGTYEQLKQEMERRELL